MNSRTGILASITLGAAIAACSPGGLERLSGIDPLARAGQDGFMRVDVETSVGRLVALERGARDAPVTVVYFEGDGAAWRSPTRPPADPTPRWPIALELARRDRSQHVVWLARPCQFLKPAERAACPLPLWTTRRYSAKVVLAIDHVLNALLVGGPEQHRLILAGHSGGGVIALLVASQRRDVAAVVTIAANIDVAAWTRIHDATPLTESLDPARMARALRATPQLHLVGSNDAVVPVQVTEAYLAALGAGSPARMRAIAGFDHRCCWADGWPERLLGVSGLEHVVDTTSLLR